MARIGAVACGESGRFHSFQGSTKQCLALTGGSTVLQPIWSSSAMLLLMIVEVQIGSWLRIHRVAEA